MSDKSPTGDDPWPSPSEQIRNAIQYTWDIRERIERERIQRRVDLEAARDAHRETGRYGEIHAEAESSLCTYENSDFLAELAKEYSRAGLSHFAWRRRRERASIFGELERRTERREEIVESNSQLDEIDRTGRFDSANVGDHPRKRPLPHDHHVNRAWKRILKADACLVAQIQMRRRTTKRHSLYRALLRYVVIAAWTALFIWIALRFEEPERQIWLLIPMLGVPGMIVRRARFKDRFIQGVEDVRSEHERARNGVHRRLCGEINYGRPRDDFGRDASRCALAEFLKEFR